MRLFDENKFLRFLLIFASIIFTVFIPSVIENSTHFYWIIPYVFACIFLIAVAFVYKFPVANNRKRISDEVQISMQTSSTRDFKKDLLQKDELFKTLVDLSATGFWTFDVVLGKVYWSERALKLLHIDWSKADDSMDTLKAAIIESDWENFKEVITKSLETGEKFNIKVNLLNSIDKSETLYIAGQITKNDDNKAQRIIGSITPTIDALDKEKQSYYAYQDVLTGVYNRKFFLEKLKVDVDLSLLNSDYRFAVAILDIDRFSAINASYSINVGDSVLKIVADRIKSQCSKDDTIARIGSDIFAIVLHNIHSEDEVKAVVRRIHNTVRLPIQLDGGEIYICASMSVTLNSEVDCLEDILTVATASLREMKKNENHGCIQFHCSNTRQTAMELYKLEFEIQKAIRTNQFVLLYQPVVDIGAGNRIVAFEALVRWKQPSGYISPAEFIPIAEETGLIVPMGAIILRMACAQAKKWVDMGFEDLQVAVNFSAKQFAMESMLSDLKQVLKETELNPKNLKIEITEYTAMSEAEKTVEIMKAVTGMGIQISIDDFGTGYSSLSYLKRFPVHTLKMDKSFVDNVTENEEDASFARMIIGLAKSLNLDLIAEGVETEMQLKFLENEGCALIQGFFFSKPLEPDKALEYLLKHYNPETSKLLNK